MSLNGTLHISGLQDLPLEPAQNLPSSLEAQSPSPFPEGGLQAWLVVLGSLCITTSSFGLQTAIGCLNSYWETHQLSDYSASEIGWISGVNLFLTFILGAQIGPLFDRYGPRWLLVVGSFAFVGSLAAMTRCRHYWEFMVTYGLLAGAATAALVTTSVGVIAHWFEEKRGQANGVVFLGCSAGGVVIPLIMEPLLRELGWAGAMRVLALIIGVLCVVGNLLIRGRLPNGRRSGSVDLACFRDMRFIWLTVGVSGGEFVLFGALGLLPTFALERGFNAQQSFMVIAVLNAGSSIGRYLAGWVSDKLGRFNTALASTGFTVVVTFGIWIPLSITRSLTLLYIFAAIFGFGSGSIVSLAPVCFGDLCKADQYGKFCGTGYSVVSFATLICIPMGGALFSSIGAEGFVVFFGGILFLSLLSFVMARWACLDYRWKWWVKI